jgi:hypothetical protein
MYRKIFIITMLIFSTIVASNPHEEKLNEFKGVQEKNYSKFEKIKKEKLKEFAQEKHNAEQNKAKSHLIRAAISIVAMPVVFVGLGYIMVPLGLATKLTETFGSTTSDNIQYVLAFGDALIGIYAIYEVAIGLKHYLWPNYPKSEDKSHES